jgi:hypothetical protein
MWKLPLWRLLGMFAILVCGAIFVYYALIEPSTGEGKKTQPEKTARQIVREEIARHEARDERGQRLYYKEEASPTLAKMIKDDPDFVAVVIGWHQMKDWGSITNHVPIEVLDRAEKDSSAALKELKKFLVEEFTLYLVKQGYKNPAQERVSWCNNNPCTAFLLIKLPVAERAGKKRELLCSMCGVPSGEKGSFWEWISSYVPDEGKHDWYGGGIWPWKNEEPPTYWHACQII